MDAEKYAKLIMPQSLGTEIVLNVALCTRIQRNHINNALIAMLQQSVWTLTTMRIVIIINALTHLHGTSAIARHCTYMVCIGFRFTVIPFNIHTSLAPALICSMVTICSFQVTHVCVAPSITIQSIAIKVVPFETLCILTLHLNSHCAP